MMMWMSHRNAHASRALVLCAALATASHVHAAPEEGMRRATSAEVADVTARAVSLFKDDVPDAPGFSVKPARTLYWSAPQGGRLLALVSARFPGASSGYCRLVTVADGPAAPVLVDLPMDVNADSCRGFRDVLYLDINGDGKPDVAASMTIRANSFDGDVDQPVVYLSNADTPGGYCYSAAASRNLEPAVMGSVGKVRQALDRERRRLGVPQFGCAADGAR